MLDNVEGILITRVPTYPVVVIDASSAKPEHPLKKICGLSVVIFSHILHEYDYWQVLDHNHVYV